MTLQLDQTADSVRVPPVHSSVVGPGSLDLEGNVTAKAPESLPRLLERLAKCQPPERISLRDGVLAYGAECVAPLTALVDEHPDLAASVASWLGVLVGRDPTTRPEAVAALRQLVAKHQSSIAREVLDRLNESERVPAAKGAARPRPVAGRDRGAEVHALVIQAAKEGRTLFYSDLGTNRSSYGKYLHQILVEEFAAGRPPLSAIVVSKSTGRPGAGFLEAMLEIGYARHDEREEDVWPRAVAEVFAYWRDQA